MKKIKEFYLNSKFAGVLQLVCGVLFLFIAYKVYKKWKQSQDINKLQDAVVSASGSGKNVNGVVEPLNLVAVVEAVWYEQFETLVFTDKDKLVKLINSVPVFRMREFSRIYNTKVVSINLNYHWWAGNWHKPESVIVDINYFLGSRVVEVSKQLNAI